MAICKRYIKILLLSAALSFLTFEVCAKDYVQTTDNMAELLTKVNMQPNPAEDTIRYLAGGLVGTFVGFGIGHAVQGRWYDDYGWAFTTTQLVGLAAAIVAFPIAAVTTSSPSTVALTTSSTTSDTEIFELTNTADSVAEGPNEKELKVAVIIAIAGLATFAISRLFETVHVWTPITTTTRSAGKRKAAHHLAAHAEPTFSVAPLLTGKQFGLQLALRL